MDQVDDQSVNEQVAPVETENHEEQPTQEAKVAPIEDKQERNWRKMREEQEQLKRKLKEKDEMVERMLQMHLSSQPKVQEIDELDSINDEEFLPKGKQKKLVKKEVEPLQKEIDELKKQLNYQKQTQFLDNLKRQYSDFDEIVNAETLAVLEEQEPELANTIADLKDPYKIGMQSYKFIKALNIASKTPEVRHAKEAEKKIEKNAKTVQTPQAFDKRPMAQAFRLTEAEKSKLYEEMTGFARMASSVPELS